MKVFSENSTTLGKKEASDDELKSLYEIIHSLKNLKFEPREKKRFKKNYRNYNVFFLPDGV